MLTKHNYQPSDTDILDKESDIFKCCRKNVPEDPKCTDCCYDTWSEELKTVTQQHDRAQEKAIQAKKKLDFALDKSQRYKTWLEELTRAEELARKICYQLEIIAGQSEKIWFNSLKAVEAIEILFCMIRDFYMQVDYIKKRYDELASCINNNSDPSLEKDKGILKCLAEYFKKLEEVIKTRDEILKTIVEAIKLSNLIRNNISTQDCPDDYDPCNGSDNPCNCGDSGRIYYGFKTIICEWYCAFSCDEPCIPCEENKTQVQQKNMGGGNPDTHPTKPNLLCAEECELEPMFGFPICNNKYKCEVEKCYKKADEDAKKAAGDFKDASREKEALSACKDSLVKAIAEVDPKIRCK